MNAGAAVLYTLITVTGGGNVEHSRGYETLHMCEEAKSLAMTGETIEAYKAEEDALAKQTKKINEDFFKNHPPRPPRDKYERDFAKNQMGSISSYPGIYCGPSDDIKSETCGGMSVTKDGLIQMEPKSIFEMTAPINSNTGEFFGDFHGHTVARSASDIKIAECVIEPTSP